MNKNIYKKFEKLYQRDGFLHIKKFFKKNEILNLLDKIKGENKDLIKKKIKVINPHLKIKEIRQLYKDKKLVDIAKHLLIAEKINGLQSEFFINHPKKSKGHPPHQDDYFLKTGRNNSINIWIPLVNVEKKNGALVFFKKSSNGKIYEKINHESLNDTSKKNKFFSRFKKKIITCKVGDIIVISNFIFHKSYDNKSQSKRFAIAFGYIRQGAPFEIGRTAKRKLTKLY